MPRKGQAAVPPSQNPPDDAIVPSELSRFRASTGALTILDLIAEVVVAEARAPRDAEHPLVPAEDE